MEFISSNFLAIFMALLSGSMLIWSFVGNAVRGIKEVDARTALQLINHKEAFVLDVREPAEFKEGHILNATLIPLGKLSQRVGELEKYRDHPMVVVCRSGNRSGSACALLSKQGFTQVHNLGGGMMGWQGSNLPVSK